MSNLLDKSSIVLTPTAYDNGKVLCVKPSDGSGDFDFSRNSAATRVNAQGLVEDVQILSSNLVQNGSFSQLGSEEITNGNFSQQGSELVTNGDFATDTNWTKGTGWSISGGSANCDGTDATSNLNQVITSFSGKTFLVEGNASNVTQGFVYISLGGTDLQIVVNSNGSFKHYVTITSGSSTLFISARNNFIGSIDNVSVVEVGQDWTLGTGWSIGDSVASCDGTQTGGTSLYQSALQQNKSYKITFSITSITAGGVGVVNSPKYTTTGTFTYYYNVTGTDSNLYVNANTDFIGSITNISVKEVGQNWDLGTGWIVDQANSNASSIQTSTNNYLQQTISTLSNNKLYRVLFDLNIISSAVTTIGISNSGAFGQLSSSERFYTTSGTKTFDALYSSSYPNYIRFVGGIGTEFTITNISIIEITDDTNLPRINYEGFSYQDALGSEIIKNGTFTGGTQDWSLDAGVTYGSDNLVFATASNQKATQINTFTVGKTYKVSIELVSYTSGIITVRMGGVPKVIPTTLGVHTWYIVATGNLARIEGTFGIGVNAIVDNVSVKEVLGQEVVPDSGCGSWLWEPQSTNLITYSEDFSQSVWNKSNVTLTSNNAVSPNGTQNASKLVATGADGFLQDTITVTSGTTYTLSVYLKTVSGTLDTAIGLGSPGFPQNEGEGGRYKNIIVTNEWKRYTLTSTADASASTGIGVGGYNTFSTGEEVLVWGIQVEQQSYATSYIPTDGQASGVTRNQDVCTNGGSAASINSTEGVLYAEVSLLSPATGSTIISLSDGGSNRLYFEFFTLNRLYAIIENGISQFIEVQTITQTNNNKIAFKYSASGCKLYINGTGYSFGGLNFLSGTLNTLNFASSNGTSSKFVGNTKCLAVWKEALSDDELEKLTTI